MPIVMRFSCNLNNFMAILHKIREISEIADEDENAETVHRGNIKHI